ncbi:ParB-like nuclease domain-containing protein [Aliarcobacter faecis]|uniref:ParB/RepB/Spo0J family partition protein n=1 Tax=Aliarcobacter faecis TaxID=1564138 RepID=UPI0004B1A337|nr:ParB/RepB/Spo0J family partition protein [Aliarcobacter faecis]QKF72752.1 ParB-like nuclease domain-containing protein [Aliarcobacter faecis]
MDLSKIANITAGKTKTTGISAFSELEILKVYPNPNQPRKVFEDIESLASTIKEHGLLQPITVVKKDDGYIIVSGERRYKAHLFNKAKTIKAYILNVEDEKIEELTLIENIQRNDLTDFETAKYIVKLWETRRYEKKQDLAKILGKSESYISKAFSSLKLDDDILEDIETNKQAIPISVMDEISRVKDKDVQKEVYQKYNAGEITRDDIKEYKKPVNLKTEYFGSFEFICENHFMKDELENLLDIKLNKLLSSNKNYNCIVEKINKKQDYFQSEERLVFTLKTSKKNLEVLKGFGKNWFRVSNSFLENKLYRFTITLSAFQEKEIKETKNEIEIKRKLLNTFIYNEPLRWEDGTTIQSKFIDKNLPFEDINVTGRGYHGNKGAFTFNEINACFVFIGIKVGDYCIVSDSNEQYNLTITKVEELEDNLLLENELSVIGEVHPESFSCLEFKKINAYFYYNNLKNPDNFQGFRKGEKYKLVLKEIETKKEEINHTLERFEEAEKDLVGQAKTFTKNFPTGNLEATFKVDDLVQDKEFIDTDNKIPNTTFEKIIDYGVIDDFEYSLKFNYIDANFYFTRPRNGVTPRFDKNKKYKITIEEVENAK